MRLSADDENNRKGQISSRRRAESTRLIRRLSLPKVLLINPCVIENFPIPRLCLSVGLLAGYLRKCQKADVRIVDMQLGATVDEAIEKAVDLKPDLIGMSISYGQKEVALSILDGIYCAKQERLIDPLVALGNIIPASFPREFVERYHNLVVAHGEGEVTVVDLIRYINGEIDIEDVKGIVYRDKDGNIRQTVGASVWVQTIPLPALDTIEGVARYKGALTLELSRGCQWNVCTFCPREHKSSRWKTFTLGQTLEQIGRLSEASDRFGISRHVFLADEEFVGGMNDGSETARISALAEGLLSQGYSVKFDAAARVDQVYSPEMDVGWHVERMKMWHLCRQAGLDRLFMGIESGSTDQLRRYGKGIQPEDSIIAIRILSALGIPLRFGFITFDQLMIGLRDLKENVAFLERRDAFIKPLDVEQYGYDRLFDLLVNDRDFVADHAVGLPVHTGVSYMLATMEVLINSRYRYLLKGAEKLHGKALILDEHSPDTNMGRYKVEFVDELIRYLSRSCQKWIDRHFGIAYSVKSLYKVAAQRERKHLMSWMVSYRELSLLLLKTLIYIFDETTTADQMIAGLQYCIPDEDILYAVVRLKERLMLSPYLDRLSLVEDCMNIFDQLAGAENEKLLKMTVAGAITDADGQRLSKALERWKENVGVWTLINN